MPPTPSTGLNPSEKSGTILDDKLPPAPLFVAAALALAFTAYMLREALRDDSVRAHPAETVGKVTGEGYRHGAVAYTYSVDGIQFSDIGIPEHGSSVAVGDAISVFYCVENPGASFIRRSYLTAASSVTDVVPSAVFGLVLAGLGVYSLVARGGATPRDDGGPAE